MSDTHATAQRITALRGHFINHHRFELIQSRFALLVEKRLADIAAGRCADAHGIALSGSSGTGKSRAMARLLADARSDLTASILPEAKIISLRVPSPATLKFVGQMILRALEYNLSAERQAWYVWDIVRHQLRMQKVLFLHLDEAQDLSSRGTKTELNAVASMLKTLMTDEHWPVGILLSGTEDLEQILNHDPQLARRMDALHFGPLSPSTDGPDALELIKDYARRAKISLSEDVRGVELAERLIHAAAFQFGLMIEIIIAALEVALTENALVLETRHFAIAFNRRSACSDAFNPFIIDDYYRIDARKVFIREDA